MGCNALLLLSFCCLSSTFGSHESTVSLPVLPSRYRVSLVFEVPYIGLVMPMHVRHDAVQGKQSIQFYDGLSTEFISVKDRTVFNDVFNMTRRICIDSTPRDKSIELVDVFPDLTAFNYSGTVVFRGLQCQKWSRTLDRPGEYEEFYWDPILLRPVRWAMHSREEIFDSHIDDYSVDYISLNALKGDSWFKPPEACTDRSNVVRVEDGNQRAINFFRYARAAPVAHKPLPQDTASDFETFKRHYRRRYHSAEEERRSREHFVASAARVQQLNRAHSGNTMFALNQFADAGPSKGRKKFDEEEHNVFEVLGKGVPTTLETLLDFNKPLPPSWDWRTKAGTPPIKDQATCGSCWAFSTIAAIESQNMLTNGGNYQKLSEQFLLDCGWSGDNSACDGGSQQDTGRIISNRFTGFVPTDLAYGSYLSTDSYCKKFDGMGGVKIDGWVNFPSNATTDMLKRALTQFGVLSVSLSSVDEITYYRSGLVKTEACRNITPSKIDHAVNLVGYDTAADGTEYWILRNSWSTNWGENGYFNVEIGARDCGISLDVSFPIVNRRGDHSINYQRPSEAVDPVIIA